ncbi:hypothetical protein PC129_g6258 [Phytophthora cactorum]|uniref:Uncharacterized protein n=1 Tax=Phytophthora cactorum TaxID=29920 RepID=A0A329SZ71_9STRA|nr:hypothetical protein Pcac1_g17460 [Phytophthora cactorum]KAG2828771.1 hypothetical protein PC112_g8346 [Phytophthora cactorum]KAG2831269.1 hypothetical protein PC111_g7076 [Phytophthora cactorum]KAG2859462.1 hypothetical protein PC113_g8920 [Phytophthora cactorum]KAG2912949.1 hypothetical protein PC114_g8721 [Phytophthora cactorum]
MAAASQAVAERVTFRLSISSRCDPATKENGRTDSSTIDGAVDSNSV